MKPILSTGCLGLSTLILQVFGNILPNIGKRNFKTVFFREETFISKAIFSSICHNRQVKIWSLSSCAEELRIAKRRPLASEPQSCLNLPVSQACPLIRFGSSVLDTLRLNQRGSVWRFGVISKAPKCLCIKRNLKGRNCQLLLQIATSVH